MLQALQNCISNLLNYAKYFAGFIQVTATL